MQGFLHLKYIWKCIKVVVLILLSFFQMQKIINEFQDDMDILRVRLDHFATPSDREFTSRYRFSKDNFNRLVNICWHLFLMSTGEASPVLPAKLFVLALRFLLVDIFFSVNGYGGGIVKSIKPGTTCKNSWMPSYLQKFGNSFCICLVILSGFRI